MMVSLIIINYNGEKYLKTCLSEVSALDYPNLELLFIDNISSDRSVELVQTQFPQFRIIANKTNLGYAAAANQGIRETKGEYVLIMNPDIVFEPNYLSVLVKKFEEDPKIGAITGKLRQYNFETRTKTFVLDSTGLLCFRNRRVVDRGQGDEDKGQFDKAEEVFGATGACAFYRRAALEDIKINGEYFDESFFMYKEDIDLSWRLRLFSWKCFYEPQAVAYHGRSTGVVSRENLLEIAGNRRHLSRFQKSLGYRNERILRVKNEMWGNVFKDFFPILGKELLMTGWMLLKEPYLVKSVGQFLKLFPKALRKRREIMKRKRVTASEMQTWFK